MVLLVCLAGNALAEELTPAGQQAFDSLKAATIFRFGNGRNPGRSPFEQSVKVLLKEQNRQQVFQELIKKGSLAAQLYALTVQRAFDRERFQRNITSYLQITNQVFVSEGCIIHAKAVAQIAGEIRDGGYDQVWSRD